MNLAVVMLLGGIWHGAAWTFLAWGAYQGFWLILERALGKRALYSYTPRAVQMALTFGLVIIGWVFFRAETLADAGQVLSSMFGASAAGAMPIPYLFRPIHLIAFGAAALIVWSLPTTQRLLAKPPLWWVLSLQLLLPVALAHMHHEKNVPFLYFQF